jgi:sulfatase maturation enzyme AslB (radical SAM superfamily)
MRNDGFIDGLVRSPHRWPPHLRRWPPTARSRLPRHRAFLPISSGLARTRGLPECRLSSQQHIQMRHFQSSPRLFACPSSPRALFLLCYEKAKSYLQIQGDHKCLTIHMLGFRLTSKKKVDKTEEIGVKYLLVIETISSCNVRCVWCSMHNYSKHKLGYMPADRFEQIIRDNRQYIKETYSGVTPYGRGESLIHPHFWNICEILKRYNIPLMEIASNLSVDIDLDRLIKYRIPLCVTIGGITRDVHERVMRHSNFDLVIRNIGYLFSNKYDLKIKMNPTKWNVHQLQELPKFIESLGGSSGNIVNYTTCLPIPHAHTQEQLRDFIENVVSDDVDSHLRFTYDRNAPMYDIRSKNVGCCYLVDEILFDGQFTICCHDDMGEVNLGNVFDKSIEFIVESALYRETVEKARKRQLCICDKCN